MASHPRHTLVFDTDPGVDDALALYFALAHPDIELPGITTTFGNVTVDQASANALLLCQLAGRRIPVAQGASHPLMQAMHPPPASIHGADGLGNLPMRPALQERIEARSAAQFMVDTVRARPHQVTLVAVGPLSNLALALELDPELPQLVRAVVLMGGTIEEPGNVSPVAEANIWNDPHAADRVFKADWPLTMVGLDVTHQVVISVAMVEALAQAQQHPATDALLHAFRFYARFYGTRHPHLAQTPGCFAHDLLAMMAVVQPGLFTTVRGDIHIRTQGPAQGQTVMQQPLAQPDGGAGAAPSRMHACMGVDAAACLALFERTLGGDWLPKQGLA